MKGPFIRVVAVLCESGGQRRIKTSTYFQKCVSSKRKKSGRSQNIKVFEKLCRHRPQTYFQTSRNNWKHPSATDMEIQGPVPRETGSSPFRVFQWFLRPSTSISRVPQRLRYVKSWLVRNVTKHDIYDDIYTMVPSITNQVLFSWRN